MRIEIAQRLRPFSHKPGVLVPLPGSLLGFQIFPALLRMLDLSHSSYRCIQEITLPVQGPVSDFTVFADLEKCCLLVSFRARNGFIRYRLFPHGLHSFVLEVEKGELPTSPQERPPISLPQERLSLGNHKAQEAEQIRSRHDLTEILPLWFRLGQLLPEFPMSPLTHFSRSLLEVFEIGFSDLFFPSLEDVHHHGVALPSTAQSPLALLKEGSQHIRSLFVQQDNDQIALLPLLPPQLYCGRFINVQAQPWCQLDMEWSKKQLRRVVLTPLISGSICLKLQSSLASFRVRHSLQDRGQRHAATAPLSLVQHQPLLLDRFEH